MRTKFLIKSNISIKRGGNYIRYKVPLVFHHELYYLRIDIHTNNMLIHMYGRYQIQVSNDYGRLILERRID